MIADYDIDPDDFFFNDTLDATAIAALPGEVNGKNRLEAEKKLKSNLYLCNGDGAQTIKKAVSNKTERYPRISDEMQMYLNGSESLHMSEGCFTEESRETTKQSRTFMQK